MSFLGYIFLFMVLRWIYSAFFAKNSGNPYQQQREVYRQRSTGTVSPQDFELNLLSLCSIVIKADGRASDSELRYVRNYFIQSYGQQRASQIFKVFNEVVKKREINAQRICNYLNMRTRVESRIQILHFLFGIAKADGSISSAELRILEQIAGYLQLTQRDFISIKAMFIKERDNAYKILEIDKTATDSEVKKAYRTMAKKYHPDKLMDMDEAYRKGAEEKFRNVQEAYETVRQERGMA